MNGLEPIVTLHHFGHLHKVSTIAKIPLNLKTAVSPRKARNKSECCLDLAIHPLGDGLQFGISLKIFVLFVFFVDEMIFLG
jgi:hypothetical protein